MTIFTKIYLQIQHHWAVHQLVSCVQQNKDISNNVCYLVVCNKVNTNIQISRRPVMIIEGTINTQVMLSQEVHMNRWLRMSWLVPLVLGHWRRLSLDGPGSITHLPRTYTILIGIKKGWFFFLSQPTIQVKKFPLHQIVLWPLVLLSGVCSPDRTSTMLVKYDVNSPNPCSNDGTLYFESDMV